MDHLVLVLGIAFALLELAAIAAAAHAVMTARTSQGAIAWAISLVTFPYLTLPLYLILGPRKFQGYVTARRAGDFELQRIVNKITEENVPEIRAELKGDFQRCMAMEQLAEMPFTRWNDAELLIDGEATFNAIFQGIDSAKEYLLVQFFIVHDDQLGTRLKSHLLAKAKEGVRVFFLYDMIGSHKLSEEYINELSQAGVEIKAFKSSKHANRFQINFRNHRKIVIVDGHTAYVGGHNVGDEYMGAHPKLSPWRDTHVKVTGPAVLGVQLTFVEDWHWITGTTPELNWKAQLHHDNDKLVLTLPTGPADELDTCGLFFVEAINSAKSRVWIISPYFVPDESVISALQLAAMRGVDVRILLPSKADHLLVYLASFSYYQETLSAGIKLYRYEKGFLHQKVLLVDDDLAAVGTANLDNRSFRLNFEITMLFADTSFASEVEQMLNEDFSNSREVSLDEYLGHSFPFRVAVQVARLSSPML